jgi:hypothetical protein
MKKLIFGLLAVASIGAALPASAQVVVRERPNGSVVVRPAYAAPPYRHHHHRHVWVDRYGHRHWR